MPISFKRSLTVRISYNKLLYLFVSITHDTKPPTLLCII